jgi:hypothetical protein
MEFSDKEILGFGGALASFLGGLFAASRWIGRNEERINAQLLDHAEKLAEHESEIAEIREEHTKDLGDIRAFFTNAAGGQKFMTFPDHDIICIRNSKSMISEIQHLTVAINSLTVQSATMGKEFADMRVDIGVIKSELKKQ